MPKPVLQQPETQVVPKPELEKRSRRRFSTEFKLRIIAKADACQYGELGELLRSEGLYSGQLQQWRKELADGGEAALSKTQPGPRSALTPDQRRIQQLEKDVSRLKHRLEITQDCVDLQKKPYRCWIGHTLAKPNECRLAAAAWPFANGAGLSSAWPEPEYGLCASQTPPD